MKRSKTPVHTNSVNLYYHCRNAIINNLRTIEKETGIRLKFRDGAAFGEVFDASQITGWKQGKLKVSNVEKLSKLSTLTGIPLTTMVGILEGKVPPVSTESVLNGSRDQPRCTQEDCKTCNCPSK